MKRFPFTAKRKVYSCSGRLYKIEELMGSGFLRISKSTIINLKYLDSVEPSFNRMMLVKLKNGSKDYVSRKYLPALKSIWGYRRNIMKKLIKIVFFRCQPRSFDFRDHRHCVRYRQFRKYSDVRLAVLPGWLSPQCLSASDFPFLHWCIRT